jgi:hypothetical protein
VREKAKQELEQKMPARVDKKLAQTRNRQLKDLLGKLSSEEIDAFLANA